MAKLKIGLSLTKFLDINTADFPGMSMEDIEKFYEEKFSSDEWDWYDVMSEHDEKLTAKISEERCFI